MKNKGISYDISWSIICKCVGYSGGGGACDLCLTETLLIIDYIDDNLLNKRDELVSKCRHKNKYMLKCLKNT